MKYEPNTSIPDNGGVMHYRMRLRHAGKELAVTITGKHGTTPAACERRGDAWLNQCT
ncbi:hypothetical protein [Methanoregula sp.]|uniref:hypothetical protein n=1 Tax=Methanoregula sp. TaxID=2052170 RepID=UPI003C78535B